MNRVRQAVRLSIQLGQGGLVVADAGSVRWYEDDPTGGKDSDWSGAGFYLRDGDDIRYLGHNAMVARTTIAQIKRRVRREMAPSRDERRARALKAIKDVLGVAALVAPIAVSTVRGLRD